MNGGGEENMKRMAHKESESERERGEGRIASLFGCLVLNVIFDLDLFLIWI